MDIGELVHHALNRANFRSALFKHEGHYQDFLDLVEESLDFVAMRILAYCLMPNHWHLVLYPRADGDLAKFLQPITLTHTQRDHARTRTAGLQVAARGKGRPFHDAGSLRGKKRPVRRAGQEGRGLALIERVRPPLWK
jgi:putative transposase